MKLTVGRLVESAAALELEILREDSTAKKNSAAMDQDSPSTILSAKWISEKALKWASFPKNNSKRWRARWDLNPGPPAPQADVIFQARLRAHDQLQADLILVLFSEELGAIYFYHVSVESRR